MADSTHPCPGCERQQPLNSDHSHRAVCLRHYCLVSNYVALSQPLLTVNK